MSLAARPAYPTPYPPPGAPRPQDAKGQAEKKWLVMALHEAAAPGPKGSAVPGRTGSPREPLGRVVVDLADFAAEDGRATRALAVAFGSPATKAAVGPAKMTLTIGRGPTHAPARGPAACVGPPRVRWHPQNRL